MPIFEYRCRDCGARFERILSSATATTTCKKCGSQNVEKQLSVFAVAGSSLKSSSSEPGPCRTCGIPGRGMSEE